MNKKYKSFENKDKSRFKFERSEKQPVVNLKFVMHPIILIILFFSRKHYVPINQWIRDTSRLKMGTNLGLNHRFVRLLFFELIAALAY